MQAHIDRFKKRFLFNQPNKETVTETRFNLFAPINKYGTHISLQCVLNFFKCQIRSINIEFLNNLIGHEI